MCRDYWGLSRALFCGAPEDDTADSTVLHPPLLLSFPLSSLQQLITAAPSGWAACLLPSPPAALGCQGNLQHQGLLQSCRHSPVRLLGVGGKLCSELGKDMSILSRSCWGLLGAAVAQKESFKNFVSTSSLKCTQHVQVHFCSQMFFSMSGAEQEQGIFFNSLPQFHYWAEKFDHVTQCKCYRYLFIQKDIQISFYSNYVYIFL